MAVKVSITVYMYTLIRDRTVVSRQILGEEYNIIFGSCS